jgi:hypothetical protein
VSEIYIITDNEPTVAAGTVGVVGGEGRAMGVWALPWSRVLTSTSHILDDTAVCIVAIGLLTVYRCGLWVAGAIGKVPYSRPRR